MLSQNLKNYKMKKEITIKKTIITKILKSLMISILVFFILENFGEFEYKVDLWKHREGSHIIDGSYIIYNTITSNKIYSDTLLLSDVRYPENGYFETYLQKLPYYSQATIEDIGYILVLTIFLTLILLFNEKFKFKLN